MNETTTRIILELGVLAFFGFLYYIWQRRKILRNDLYNAYQQVDQLIYNINEFLKEDDNSQRHHELSLFIHKVEDAYKSENLKEIYESLCKDVSNTPEEIVTDIEKLKEQIQFHLK